MVFDYLQKGSYSPFENIIKTLLSPLWSFYCWLSGMMVIATGFALVLQAYTGTDNPAVMIDGSPQNDAFEQREGSKLPTLKVPLNGKVSYQLPWHIREGGCERIMTRTFQKGTAEIDSYILSKQSLEKPHAVGRPGIEYVDLTLPDGIRPGIWLYQAIGSVRNCPVPRKPETTLYAEFYIDVYDPDGPISIEIGSPMVMTPKVKMGNKLQYKESFKRTEEINSEILFTFTEVNGKTVVIDRRPGAYTRAGEFTNVTITTPLPPGIYPGKWKINKSVISTRPGGKTRVDPMFEFEFEVTS